MKKLLIIALTILCLTGCSNQVPPVNNTETNQQMKDQETVIYKFDAEDTAKLESVVRKEKDIFLNVQVDKEGTMVCEILASNIEKANTILDEAKGVNIDKE